MKVEKRADVVVHQVFNSATGKVNTPKKWLRTCQSCNENFYTRESFKEHMEKGHGKNIAKSVMADPHVVEHKPSAAKLDVPEEILVRASKHKKQEEPTVAKTRKRRKRRTKAEIEADKQKEGK